jgi:hypothetical protein
MEREMDEFYNGFVSAITNQPGYKRLKYGT